MADNKAMHAELAIGRFKHGGLARACRVMAIVTAQQTIQPKSTHER